MTTKFSHWESADVEHLLKLLVGQHYGKNPISQLDKIIEVKCHEASNVVKNLELGLEDVVMDFGSGCGFIADNIAPKVKWIECADISQSFLNYAKKVNHSRTNVGFYHISNPVISLDKTFSAIYSVNVFIHFNLYECFLNLLNCYQCLEPNGRLYFDILNSNNIDIKSDTWQRQLSNYSKDRNTLFRALYYNHKETIKDISEQIGFELINCFDENDHSFFLLKKTANQS